MKPLVIKEIRLLLPGYILALLLAVVPIWFLTDFQNVVRYVTQVFAPLFFGVLVMALSSFGREFGMNTFPLLMAQPLTRSRLWWTKFAILALAMATILGAYLLSLNVWHGIHPNSLTGYGEMEAIAALAFSFVVIMASALWTTLLLRQIVAAFWVALLIPSSILLVILWIGGTVALIYIALGLYSFAGLWWAGRQFNHAQEVAWTGGEVAMPAWRPSRAASQSATRFYHPIATLFRKELKLHAVALMGMAGLFLVHLGVLAFRKTIQNSTENLLLLNALDMFGGLWLLVPLLTASLTVADERRLGTMEEHLCLPISSRTQFAIKLLFATVLCGLLSGLLCWTAEAIGFSIGARGGLGGINIAFDGSGLTILLFSFISLSLISFYASTLTRNLLQAIAAATVLSFLFRIILIASIYGARVWGIQIWDPPITFFIALPTIVTVIIWLAFVNFQRLSETRRLWLRNIGALAATLLGITCATAGLYHRAWEYLTPMEPPHGPARLTIAEPPVLNAPYSPISALLPDGRWWQDCLAYDGGRHLEYMKDSSMHIFDFTIGGEWFRLNGNHFFDGSNWVDKSGGYSENVGIQSNGTLWVSEKPIHVWRRVGNRLVAQSPARLCKFGEDTDWKNVASGKGDDGIILLKTDGTLWGWGTNRSPQYHGLIGIKPHQLGSDSDWARIYSSSSGFVAWKNNGQAWRLNRSATKVPGITLDPELTAERWEPLDNANWRSLTTCWGFQFGVRDDGTLWTFGEPPSSGGTWGENDKRQPIQFGTSTNWVSLAAANQVLVALKSDGTLWKWDFRFRSWWLDGIWPFSQPPKRLGIHSDWVALGESSQRIVSIAADGSLWHWAAYDTYDTLLAPSRKPIKLANLLTE
ncbi:MAG: hypothetical protein JWR26_4803 [Pedosphaera sp.]|nr:hypothetical protein [Pedosphaera sp.]